ncbi:MAG TPA: hypothetical protein VKX49_22610 [Bryobacteraceae bacterium]|nr:hypothetical protein [Bryobacteraceae bacterium]
MQQLVYTMHFRGQASRSGQDPVIIRTTSSGTSCRIETVVGPTGVETTLHPAPGDLAFLEYEIRLTSQGAFQGSGVLTFGDEGADAIQFSSEQKGQFLPNAAPGVMAGGISWKVEGGSGRFAAATGFISSAFTLNESGQMNEYHCGLIFIGK